MFAIFTVLGLVGGLIYGKVQPKSPKLTQIKLLTDHADPNAVFIKVGQFVEFDSKDGKSHNIGQGSGDDEVHQSAHQDEHNHTLNGLQSGPFGAGEGYRLQFKKPGSYDFHDHLNPKISIKVIVY